MPLAATVLWRVRRVRRLFRPRHDVAEERLAVVLEIGPELLEVFAQPLREQLAPPRAQLFVIGRDHKGQTPNHCRRSPQELANGAHPEGTFGLEPTLPVASCASS